MVKLPEIFNRYYPYIEEELKSLFDNRNLFLYDMMRYHLGWINNRGDNISNNSGKKLRATLCLLACESLDGDFRKALPLAAAIELIHNYSLVHDDIQDDDKQRRHRPTVWSIWGKPQAINAGSALKVLASLSVAKLGDYNISSDKQVEVFEILNNSCLKMIEGQFLDINFENRSDITIENYLEMIEKKTSALIEGALKIGAVLNIEKSKLEPFEKFGRYLGLAFQIRDDILGIWGNNTKTGKPQGNDIRKRKKTLPIVFCLQVSNKKTKERLLKIYSKKRISERNIGYILSLLNDIGSKRFCEEKSIEYYQLALKEIKNLPIFSDKVSHFKEISRFLIKRDF
ncbi:MAG: polyprenyl synthetase family protein [Actinobacteria bacterium]|nr:polyprenyl synthetase family protein [Actinomycetota bacterium]